jgi:chromosomal replication initiator protein
MELAGSLSKTTWDRVLVKIERKVNAVSFNTWFRPTTQVAENNDLLRVGVPSVMFAEWLRTNYAAMIKDALLEIERPGMAVEFLPKNGGGGGESGPPVPPPPAPKVARGTDFTVPLLNPRYTFDRFVVSSCNQFAHAAAMAVAEKPTHAYNPLFVYGGVGLGKTHLMQAIGNCLCRKGQSRMMYLSAEHFMNELINAIRFEKTFEFKERYRKVDLLLIDDIQFLAGKERTQEEFFHTFNALYDAQKQIVITSDCPPREIPTLEERLRSRFEWGLIADIQPPDLETKVAILRKKAEAENANLPDDVALFIATHCKSNIRELEGALIKVMAYASMRSCPMDLATATEILREFVVAEGPVVTVESIQKLVSNYFNLKVPQIKSRTNAQKISYPRQIAMYLAKQLTSCSLQEIGRRFGGKHHTTVLHAVDKITAKRASDPEFARLLQSFIEQLH